jgi:hypothetical protein
MESHQSTYHHVENKLRVSQRYHVMLSANFERCSVLQSRCRMSQGTVCRPPFNITLSVLLYLFINFLLHSLHISVNEDLIQLRLLLLLLLLLFI